MQTLERFALSVTGESRGIFFSVVREGVADKPLAPFALDYKEAGITLSQDAGAG